MHLIFPDNTLPEQHVSAMQCFPRDARAAGPEAFAASGGGSSSIARSLARSLARGAPCLRINALREACPALQYSYIRSFLAAASEAPAVQLAEHARAVLEDDRRLGVQRMDNVLIRLARGGERHAVPWLHLFVFLTMSRGKSRRKTILQAEVAVAAFDDAAMRAPVRIRRVKVGNADSHPIILPSDFVRALHESGKLPVVLPHKDLEKTKRALAVFWQRWKLQHGAAHSIFEHVRQEDLCLTLPVRIHGDEGRSGLTHFGLILEICRSVPSFSHPAIFQILRQEKVSHYADVLAMYHWQGNVQNC